MSEKPFYENPFETESAKVTAEVARLQAEHGKRIMQSPVFREGVVGMIRRLLEMNRLLSESFLTDNTSLLDQCQRLATEIHQEENALTGYILHCGARGESCEGVIRLPYRLERIGDMLEDVLHCCRIKIDRDIPFSLQAKEEVGELLLQLEHMMDSLRDAFVSQDRDPLEEMIGKGKRLAQVLEDFKSAHWMRVEKGTTAPEASSLFREILDSVKWTNEYLEKLCTSLRETDEMSQNQPGTRRQEVHPAKNQGDQPEARSLV
jgi:Na+/phosphate symporter